MSKSDPNDLSYRNYLTVIAKEDVELVLEKDKSYGASWKKRGGVGAYFVTIRKIDRLEEQVKKHGYDIFAAMLDDSTDERLEDTIRDLRCYLDLISAEVRVIRERNIASHKLIPPTDTWEKSVRDDYTATLAKKCANCSHHFDCHRGTAEDLNLVIKCTGSGDCACDGFQEIPF